MRPVNVDRMRRYRARTGGCETCRDINKRQAREAEGSVACAMVGAERLGHIMRDHYPEGRVLSALLG